MLNIIRSHRFRVSENKIPLNWRSVHIGRKLRQHEASKLRLWRAQNFRPWRGKYRVQQKLQITI